MQPNDGNQEWQQPTARQNESSYTPNQEPALQAPSEQSSELTSQDLSQPEAANEDRAQEVNDAVVQWEAPEYLALERGKVWYIWFAVVVLALVAVSIFFIKSFTFTILIPVMATALFVYTRRPPAIVSYTVSRKGVHVNDKLYTYQEFKAFSVHSAVGQHVLTLVPLKRFNFGLTAYFPEEVGEALVDMLAARLPMQTYSTDFIDKLLAKLRM